MCHPNEWDSIGSFYDHSWGLLNKLGESSGLYGSLVCTFYLTNAIFLFVSATVCPTILFEQEAFLERVFKIPLEERSLKKLVNMDTLHAFCGGPIPFEEA